MPAPQTHTKLSMSQFQTYEYVTWPGKGDLADVIKLRKIWDGEIIPDFSVGTT